MNMGLFNRIRKKHWNWESGNKELEKLETERLKNAQHYSFIYNIPINIVVEILKYRKYDCPYDELDDPTDYEAMLIGAYLAYKSTNQISAFITKNDPRAKEVTQFLCKKRIRFEMNPIYGLSMVNDPNLRTEYELKYFPENTNHKLLK